MDLKLGTGLALLCLALAGPANADTVTVFFDNSGDEAGITPVGTQDFSFGGANFANGVVESAGPQSLFASLPAGYFLSPDTEITFDVPIEFATFFFVDVDLSRANGGVSYVATAYDEAGNAVAAVESNDGTFFNDPNNFVTLDPVEAIARITFTPGEGRGGTPIALGNAFFAIDNFSFAPVPLPASLWFLGSGLIGLISMARRRKAPG